MDAAELLLKDNFSITAAANAKGAPFQTMH
jgi:hypothetical protein